MQRQLLETSRRAPDRGARREGGQHERAETSRRNTRKRATDRESERAAWTVPGWCAELEIGRATYYTLAIRPRSIKIGRLNRIIESPADYAERMAKMQAAA